MRQADLPARAAFCLRFFPRTQAAFPGLMELDEAMEPSRTSRTSSPARRSRLREKEDLQQLNDRLAAYIERVRSLEEEKEVLGVKSLYEAELSDARKLLDETATDRARLQIQLGRVQSELDEASRSLKQKGAELAAAESRLSILQENLTSSEASLSSTRIQNAALLRENMQIQTRLEQAEDGHAVAKRQLEAETLMRVDLENRVQSLTEEIQLQKKVKVLLRDRDRVQDRSELALVLQDLRSRHEEQVELFKEDLQNCFQSKLLLSCPQQSDSGAPKDSEELLESQAAAKALLLQVEALREENRGLQESLVQQECSRRRLLEEQREAQREVRHLLDRHEQEYQDLLDVKVQLDLEILNYRGLLEGEESRLSLSPPGGGVAKKRRLEVEPEADSGGELEDRSVTVETRQEATSPRQCVVM